MSAVVKKNDRKEKWRRNKDRCRWRRIVECGFSDWLIILYMNICRHLNDGVKRKGFVRNRHRFFWTDFIRQWYRYWWNSTPNDRSQTIELKFITFIIIFNKLDSLCSFTRFYTYHDHHYLRAQSAVYMYLYAMHVTQSLFDGTIIDVPSNVFKIHLHMWIYQR